MSGKITLRVVEGSLSGHQFTFAERTVCVIGRAPDCALCLPDDKAHRTISRYHCLLDINPPAIRIRDFGSRNGTFVNGQKIGQRRADQSARQGVASRFPEYDLAPGDRIKLGSTVLEVDMDLGPPPSTPGDGGTALFDLDSADFLNSGDLFALSMDEDPQRRMEHLLKQAADGDPNLAGLAGFTIEKELGKGGMGAVYLAHNEHTQEKVALKVMLPRVAGDPRAQGLFLREARNTQALKHPNVVELKTSGWSGNFFFFTLEYCNGGSVDQLMRQRREPLSLEQAAPIILQVLEGLEYAHHAEIPQVPLAGGGLGKGRGLVHRDLKPANIYLSINGKGTTAKVADFGLAKSFDAAGLSGQTATGALAGTPVYMPRQQVINFKYAKPEIDVWAAAASLYNMLTGFYPRDFPKDQDPWLVILRSGTVPIRERNPKISERLARVIDTALNDQGGLPIKEAQVLRRELEAVL